MLPTRLLALLAVITALAAPPVLGQDNIPIDDFEILAFDVSQIGPGSSSDTQMATPAQIGHIISQTRRVECSVGAAQEEQTRAWLSPGGAGDDAMHAAISSTGSVSVSYEFPAVDLTVGGVVDTVEVALQGPGGTTVSLFLVDENLNLDAETFPLNSFPTQFPLDRFSEVDLRNITALSLVLFDPGNYILHEIRLRRDDSRGVDFFLHAVATAVPPLPSPPLGWTLYRSILPLYDVDLSIVDAVAGFTPALSLAASTAPSLGDGSLAHFDLSWTDLAPFEPVELAFSVEVAAVNGLVPELFPPDPVHGPEGISMSFLTMLRNGPGGPFVGTSETWITVDPGPLQAQEALTFESVSVTPNAAPLGGATTGFTVSFLLLPGAAGVETLWPILEMNWWSEWNPTITTSIAGPEIREAGPRLVAAPSVTRGSTEIRADRPFGAATRILVHDVAGRRVASLVAAPGTRSVRWDGRGASGASLPAGVYFVNLDGERAGSARVVKLR